MKINQHTIQVNEIITPYISHAIVKSLLGDHEEYAISYNGYTATITTSKEGLKQGFIYNGNKVGIIADTKEIINPTGEKVIKILMSKSINHKNKTISCPVWKNGVNRDFLNKYFKDNGMILKQIHHTYVGDAYRDELNKVLIFNIFEKFYKIRQFI